jgi:hypothetical protein
MFHAFPLMKFVSILIFSVALPLTGIMTFRFAWVQFGLPLTFIPHALQPAHPLTPPLRTLKTAQRLTLPLSIILIV